MAELKREYVVPLRRKSRTAPKWRRSKKSVSVLKDFIRQHMKTEDIVICSELNEYIWNNGAKNPPGKVSVTALRTEVGGVVKTIVNLSSVGVDKQKELYKAPAPMAEPAKETAIEAEVKEAAKEEKSEVAVEEKKASPKKEAKKEEKEEVKNG